MKLTPKAAARWAERGVDATNTVVGSPQLVAARTATEEARPSTEWPTADRSIPPGSGYNTGVYSPKLAERMSERGFSPGPYYGGTAADYLAEPTPEKRFGEETIPLRPSGSPVQLPFMIPDGEGGFKIYKPSQDDRVDAKVDMLSDYGEGDPTPPGPPSSGRRGEGGGLTPSLSQVAPYAPGESSLVENRLGGLLGAGNPYIEAARNRGLRTAHARGLLNSSIAAQAAEAAAIEAAFPIASQDASSFQEAGMLGYQGSIQSQLAREQHGYDIGTIGAQEDASSRLSTQEAQQNLEFEQFRAAAENEMRARLASMQLSSEERRVFADQAAKLGEEFLLQVSNVQRDPEIGHDAKSQVIADLQALYQAQLESLADIYDVDIEWVYPPPVARQ